MTDVVPGTILLEDPVRPALIFPVEANDPRSAAIFVEGVASIASLEILAGCVAELADADFDEPEGAESSSTTTEAGFKPGWMNRVCLRLRSPWLPAATSSVHTIAAAASPP